MQITAREVGRRLELRVGGDDDTAVVVVVPPVNAADGTRLWSFYADLVLLQVPGAEAEQDATTMTQLALGAWAAEDAEPAERERAARQWDVLNSLRWEEGEVVAQAALFWNMQGGGMEVVNTLLNDEGGEGAPKAQEILFRRNSLWSRYSATRTLPSSVSGSPTSADDSSATDTPTGT